MRGPLHRLPFSWALGLSLFSGRRKSRVSAATVVSIAGIAVGVATLTAVMSVTGGFEDVFRDRILGVYPHMVVMNRGDSFPEYQSVSETLKRVPGVIGVAASTYDEMMVSSDTGTSQAIVKGVDLEGIDRVSGLSSLLRGHDLSILKWDGNGPVPVAIGCELMSSLEVAPGGIIGLTTPIRGMGQGISGGLVMTPREAKFVVVDCVDSGFYDYDSKLVVMELGAAQHFLDRGQIVRWVEVKLNDLFQTESMKSEILRALQPYTIAGVARDVIELQKSVAGTFQAFGIGDGTLDPASASVMIQRARRSLLYSDIGFGPVQNYRVLDWKDMNRNLFSALRIQKVVIGLFFLIIVVVAAFNIVGTQLIVARERMKDISTLVALGASRMQLWKVFVAHGFVMGCIGVLFGVGLGRAVVAVINSIDFRLDARVYMISQLPATLNWADIALVAFGSAAVVLLSCVFSSLRAIRINPVDGLRRIV
ncbi:MAG TPA: ABC transporter permease [Myxococcota bacterium]|nr:ABC transporter permease [Myxococcota bacterium]HOC99397.1 ABC transporter permease [Myxococcota bacterium]